MDDEELDKMTKYYIFENGFLTIRITNLIAQAKEANELKDMIARMDDAISDIEQWKINNNIKGIDIFLEKYKSARGISDE